MKNSSITAKKRSRLLLPLTLIMIVSMACNLSSLQKSTPTPTLTATSAATQSANTATPAVTATATARPKVDLPPALVEANPNPGSELALNSPLQLVFNQEMNKSSVEAAVSASPQVSGKFTWTNAKTLTFTPDQPLPANSKLALTVGTAAKAANGMAMKAAVTVQYTTAGLLSLTQALPLDGTQDAAPSSAVVATFNRPVVALGSDDASNPVGFTLSPTANGKGKWLNTSTYIFYPDPALAGGKQYTVQINPDLKSTQGSTLDAKSTMSWSFTTALPQITAMTPALPGLMALDGSLTVTFNISMDPDSVAANFSLKDGGGTAVKGDFTWNDAHTKLTFKPSSNLPRNTTFNLLISGKAQAYGGTTLGTDYKTQVQTYPALSVLSTTPANGSTLTGYGNSYGSISLAMSAPLKATDLSSFVTFDGKSSSVSVYFDSSANNLAVSGFFEPNTTYKMTLSADLPDAWDGTLGSPYTYTFKTPEATPTLNFTSQQSSQFIFLTSEDTGVQALVTNLSSVTIKRADLKLSDLYALRSVNGTDTLDKYTPTNPTTWTQSLSVSANSNQTASLQVDPGKGSLAPGIYYYSISAKQIQDQEPRVAVLVVSPIQMVLKASAQQVFVWAVNINDDTPVKGRQVSIYDASGNLVTAGTTDENGIFQKDIAGLSDMYADLYAVMGTPGQSDFGLTTSFWNQGLSGYDYGISTSITGSQTHAYIYTDRPIYQPGQTVNFKAMISQEYNGRYTATDLKSMAVKILGSAGNMGTSPLLYSQTLTLSKYGTLNGTYTLPDTATTGTYQVELMTGTDDSTATYLSFMVANYVKPEIELNLTLSPSEIQSGKDLAAKLIATYYFGAPAGNISVDWTLYRQVSSFNLPQYQTGLIDSTWMEPYWERATDFSSLGTVVDKGQDQTAADGTLSISLPASKMLLNDTGGTEQFTLEVTAQEEGGQPVSTRATAIMHPSDDYIGVKADTWTSQAGQALGFSLETVDWKAQPVGNRSLTATFSKIQWKQSESVGTYDIPSYTAQTTLVASANPVTDASGQARLSFTPEDPGNYLLDVTEGSAHTQYLVWVGGAGSVTWTNMSNNMLHLTADADSYKAGDTANIFIPNPLGDQAVALVTLERGQVISSQMISLTSAGASLPIKLTDEDAPNVILSVTILGQEQDAHAPGYRQGYLNLTVAPTAETLNVQVTADPATATAGQSVTLHLKVTDAAGKPVVGEFSLSVEDLAVLALAKDNAADILTEYYGTQPLGVRTSLSLNAWGGSTYMAPAGGRGGGGGESSSAAVRSNFQDTAYWSPTVVTGADGTATATFTLPDNLTTWQVKARGLTTDEKVGEATTQITTSKPLLVRPQTPSFLVVGDHTQLSAIVNNNTNQTLQVAVSLQATGFELDNANQATQTISVASLGHTTVSWWGTAQDVAAIDLLFTASANGLQDAVRPDSGKLPVLHYSSPQTFSTAGQLTTNDKTEELVSVPSSYTPTGGSLTISLSSSLAATMLNGLSALDFTDTNDTPDILASFLPNLEAANTMKDLGVSNADLQNKLAQKAQEGINALLNLQNADGGWGWWGSSTTSLQNSDPYITAAALFGLSQANKSGYSISTYTLQNAQQFLAGYVHQPKANEDVSSLDEDTFELYALVTSGDTTDAAAIMKDLLAMRTTLSPWSQAMLALTEQELNPKDETIKTIISDLEAGAIQSATGVNWETKDSGWMNPGSPVFTTAVVLYSIAQFDPKSAQIQPAIRYLMANRSDAYAWNSGYETAWVLMALSASLKGSGEMQADYAYGVKLNDNQLTDNQANGNQGLAANTIVLPLSALDATYPNTIDINRGDGNGTLYYRLDLEVDQPVTSAQAISMGLSLTRAYYPAGQDCITQTCQPIDQTIVSSGAATNAVKVQLTLTLEHDMYNLVVEDFIPAGASIFNSSLMTSQQGLNDQANQIPYYNVNSPFENGYGWWYFADPQIYSDHLRWTAPYLKAGTYQLTYTLIPNQVGEFRVIPAHAWEEFFPEVQGTTAGATFKITS